MGFVNKWCKIDFFTGCLSVGNSYVINSDYVIAPDGIPQQDVYPFDIQSFLLKNKRNLIQNT